MEAKEYFLTWQFGARIQSFSSKFVNVAKYHLIYENVITKKSMSSTVYSSDFPNINICI
jgi:hypothetical protein